MSWRLGWREAARGFEARASLRRVSWRLRRAAARGFDAATGRRLDCVARLRRQKSVPAWAKKARAKQPAAQRAAIGLEARVPWRLRREAARGFEAAAARAFAVGTASPRSRPPPPRHQLRTSCVRVRRRHVETRWPRCVIRRFGALALPAID